LRSGIKATLLCPSAAWWWIQKGYGQSTIFLPKLISHYDFIAPYVDISLLMRAVLGQVDCFVQCEVVGSQISLNGVQPRDTGTPWWSLPVLWWGAVGIILASASSPIPAKLEMWASAQRDGHPAKYVWRLLFNTAKFG